MKKKMLFLVAAYAAWVVATLVYNKKTPSQISAEVAKEVKTNGSSCKAFLNNFLEVHRNFFDDVLQKVLSPEKQAFLKEKEEEFLAYVEPYQKKATKLFDEYKAKWEEFADEWKQKIDEVYKEALAEIKKMKAKAPEKIDELQETFHSSLDDLKQKLKK